MMHHPFAPVAVLQAFAKRCAAPQRPDAAAKGVIRPRTNRAPLNATGGSAPLRLRRHASN
jgi:hypothetical protein